MLSNLDVAISFGHPYSLFAPDYLLEYFGVEEGDTIEITFNTDTDRDYIVSSATAVPSSNWRAQNHIFTKELHGVLYGLFQDFPTIRGEFDEYYGDIDIEYGNKPDLSSRRSFADFWNRIVDHTTHRWEDADVLIGASLVEILTDERRIGDLLDTPLYKLEKSDFISFLENEFPPIEDIGVFDEEIDRPDEVYFAYYGEEFTDETYSRAEEIILRQEIFHADWNYTFPGFRTLVGPTAIGYESDIIEVKEESLEIVPGISQNFVALDGEFDFGAISERIADTEIQGIGEFAQGRSELPHRVNEDSNLIIFLLGDLSISVIVEGNSLTWRYPDGIDLFDQFVWAITRDIADHFDLEVSRGDRVPPSGRLLPETDQWALDTNAMYHQVVDDEPSSLLYTILSYDAFYQSTFHVPWVLRYEMNKHPDRGSASRSIVEQGKENLHLLSWLGQFGVIDVEIEPIPNQIHVDVGESDIADMMFVQYAQENDTALITGDSDLNDITSVSEIDTIDIFNYASVRSEPDYQTELREAVLEDIGYTLLTREEIVSEILSQLGRQRAQEIDSEVDESEFDPEGYIAQWVQQEEILPYPVEDTIAYKQAVATDLVLTKSAIKPIVDHINGEGQGEYIPKECLEMVGRMTHLRPHEFPYITFHVPISLIMDQVGEDDAISEGNIALYQIQDTPNSNYELAIPEGTLSSTEELNEGVQIAAEQGYPILVGQGNENLTRVAGLFGIKVVVIEPP